MLKPNYSIILPKHYTQPPSGGCVLKLRPNSSSGTRDAPAAFGRLCVETNSSTFTTSPPPPAAFGRLCVETKPDKLFGGLDSQPPSGGCVLKLENMAH